MATKESILKEFEKIKQSSVELTLGFRSQSGGLCSLIGINKEILQASSLTDVTLLAKWRAENSQAFPTQFKVTIDGTKIWCDKALINNPERILFWVVDSRDQKIGHVGLFRISEDARHVEADNIVRGEISTSDKGIMYSALRCLLAWQREQLQISQSFLRVFSNNEKAIKLYKRLGYDEIQRVALRKVESIDRTSWEEIINSPYEMAENYFISMHQVRN